MPVRIGIAAGMSIILTEDNSLTYKGGTRDEVLEQVVSRIQSGDFSLDKLATVQRWLTLMMGEIEREALRDEQEGEFRERMKAGEKEHRRLPPELRAAVESVIREFAYKTVLERSGSDPD